MLSIFLSIVFSATSFSVPSAQAYIPNAKMPSCLDGPSEIHVDNERILKFKTSTHNQYLARGFAQGVVARPPVMQNGHLHFPISIGHGPRDTLEVIYNIEFGKMPNVNTGDRVTVCGDYITSTAQAGSYPPSPEGAIIHWVHFNPGSRSGSAKHAHGFIMIENNLIGFDDAPAGDWDGRIIPTKQPKGLADQQESDRSSNGRRINDRTTSADRGSGMPTRNTQDNSGSDYPSYPRRPSQDDQSQDNQGRASQGSPDQSQGSRRRPNPGRWKPCRTLQECSARNGSF